MLKKLKIGTKFTLVLILLSIIPLAIVSISNFNQAQSEIQYLTIESLKAINNSRAAHISSIMQLRLERAQEFAGTPLAQWTASWLSATHVTS